MKNLTLGISILTIITSGAWLIFIMTTSYAWAINSEDTIGMTKFLLVLIPAFLLSIFVIINHIRNYEALVNHKKKDLKTLKDNIQKKRLEVKLEELRKELQDLKDENQ